MVYYCAVTNDAGFEALTVAIVGEACRRASSDANMFADHKMTSHQEETCVFFQRTHADGGVAQRPLRPLLFVVTHSRVTAHCKMHFDVLIYHSGYVHLSVQRRARTHIVLAPNGRK